MSDHAHKRSNNPLIGFFETDDGRPNPILLFVALTVFTAAEVFYAELPQFKGYELAPAQVESWSELGKQVLAEDAGRAKGPGTHVLALLGPQGRATLSKAAGGAELSEAEQSSFTGLVNEKIIKNKAFYKRSAFPGLKQSRKQAERIAELGDLGETELGLLNRSLLGASYNPIKQVPLNHILVIGLMIAAVIKMTMVGFYFMHMKFEGIWLFVILVPTCTLCALIMLFLTPDVGRIPLEQWVPFRNLSLLFFLPMLGIILYSVSHLRGGITEPASPH